jgi:hypothetical protein
MKPSTCTLLLLLGAALPVRADLPTLNQSFENYMLAHHYVAVGLEAGGTNQQWVHAKINGKPVVLEVDTGCTRTCITNQCARNLGLQIRDGGEGLWGVGGLIKGKYGLALINDFELSFGAINRTNTLVVLPRSAAVDWGIDGYLGADFLVLNAAVFPIAGHGILLKPGPTPPVSMSNYLSRLSFKPVPLRGEGGHIWVDAHLNGRLLKMQIDSGASFSNFRAATVRAALHEKELDFNQYITSQGVDGKRQTFFYFTPEQFDLGGVDASHQSFMATESAEFDKDEYDGLAGVDLLGRHKAIVDFGAGVLWLR